MRGEKVNITSTYNQISNSEISANALINIKDSIVATINNFLSTLLPNGELWIILGASILLSYRLKRQTNGGIFSFVVMTIVFWSALRYFGIGD